MKTDRELLELAAKAAGYEVQLHPNRKSSRNLHFINDRKNWNPLTDDGDALRLVCLLRLNVHVWDDGGDVSAAKTLPNGDNPKDDNGRDWFAESVHSGDIAAAARRAIVRAAAAIGENS